MVVKDVMYGKTPRKSFARYQEILEMPNLLEVQKTSYQCLPMQLAIRSPLLSRMQLP